MEFPGPLPAPDPGALPGDVAAALTPLVERISDLLPPPQAGHGRVSLALFDSGPGQLGSPRVAQVAAWIALARRAAAAGLGFAWGVLKGPGGRRPSGTTPAAPAALRGSAPPHEPGGGRPPPWRQRLAAAPEVGEVWMIGPPRIGSPPTLPGASRLQIWDDLTPGERRVAVAVRTGSGIAAQALLDLPDEADCVRLLRLGASAAGPAPSWPSPAVDFEPAEAVLPPPAAHDPVPEPSHYRE